jgi:hypothetical protein
MAGGDPGEEYQNSGYYHIRKASGWTIPAAPPREEYRIWEAPPADGEVDAKGSR